MTTSATLDPPMSSINAAGICTKPIESTSNYDVWHGKIKKQDRKFFKGHASEIRSTWTSEEKLASIGCNWTVDQEDLYSVIHNRVYPERKNWFESSTGDWLGEHGTREVVHPKQALEWMESFVDSCEKEISLDILGWIPHSKVFYMAAKLPGLDYAQAVGDKTDAWLMFTVNYRKPRAPHAYVWFNELVCTNGMTRVINETSASTSHRKARTYDDVAPVLTAALTESSLYLTLKNRMINTPLAPLHGKQIIREFFKDEEGLSNLSNPSRLKNVQMLERIYEQDSVLKGSELPSRQGNKFRLQSAFTQFMSHESGGKVVKGGDDYRFDRHLTGDIFRMNAAFTQTLDHFSL